MTKPPSVLLGVPLDNLDMAETIDRLAEFVRLGRLHGRTHQVATVNVDFLVNALADPEIMMLLQRAELNLADGMPLVWASRLLGTALPERVAGADLVPLLAEASAEHGWRVHLFGAAPGVADRARSAMLDRHPRARITSDAGPVIDDPSKIDETIIATLRAVDPDVLCVALGNPKQERFIAAYRGVLRSPVMIGIGGSLDMLVGDKKRAPKLMQKLGAEWVYRAAQEPGRLGRRYIHDIRVFGPQVVSYRNAVRKYSGASLLGTRTDGPKLTIHLGESSASLPPLNSGAINSIVLDFRGVEAIDPEAHSLVINALRQARQYEIPIIAIGLASTLRRCLEDYRTWSMFAPLTSR